LPLRAPSVPACLGSLIRVDGSGASIGRVDASYPLPMAKSCTEAQRCRSWRARAPGWCADTSGFAEGRAARAPVRQRAARCRHSGRACARLAHGHALQSPAFVHGWKRTSAAMDSPLWRCELSLEGAAGDRRARREDHRARSSQVAWPNSPPVGHWAGVRLSPDGRTLLAQWSAECETPQAFLVTRGTGSVRRLGGAADDSIALGWASDGRALVHFPTGVCGAPTAAVRVSMPSTVDGFASSSRRHDAQRWRCGAASSALRKRRRRRRGRTRLLAAHPRHPLARAAAHRPPLAARPARQRSHPARQG
jgi:hypothetical protein